MSLKLIAATLLLSAIGLIYTDTVDAGHCGCRGRSRAGYSKGYYETAQGSTGYRRYSYEPGSTSYRSRSYSSRSNVPAYLLPKSDPRKYRTGN